MDVNPLQPLEDGSIRSQLDQLLADAQLYVHGPEYRDFLDFVVRLRNFAPFNAMLLNIQRPGLTYAASARRWARDYNRWPKEGARPLLVMHPFGPVALVYDVQDTEGEPLPDAVWSFTAKGEIAASELESLLALEALKHIKFVLVDAGDGLAGSIGMRAPPTPRKPGAYSLHLNRNHAPVVQFGTVVHELAHLYLGHLGPDGKLQISDRHKVSLAQRELEAESVSYLVSKRRGILPHSIPYLAQFFRGEKCPQAPDKYEVARTAGRIERLLDDRCKKVDESGEGLLAAYHAEEQIDLDFGD